MFLAENSIQLVPDGTLLIHLIVIFIMVAVLNRTLLKPINKILSEREKQIHSRMTEAESLLAEADQKSVEYAKALRAAREEGYRKLEQEKAAAVKEKEIRVRELRADLSQQVTAGLHATVTQQDQARKELESQASEIGNLIAKQVLGR
jgi:F0F1-type ATP synthase membrane subunit b/b'